MRMIDRVLFRCDPIEKAAFEEVAKRRGLTLSVWARMILREEAERFLRDRGLPVPFVDEIEKENGDVGEDKNREGGAK